MYLPTMLYTPSQFLEIRLPSESSAGVTRSRLLSTHIRNAFKAHQPAAKEIALRFRRTERF